MLEAFRSRARAADWSGCSSSREQSFEDVSRAMAVEQRRVLEKLLENYFASEVARLDAEVLAVEQRRFELDATTSTGFIDRIDRLPTACA